MMSFRSGAGNTGAFFMLLFGKCCGILSMERKLRCCWITRLALLAEGSFLPSDLEKGGLPNGYIF